MSAVVFEETEVHGVDERMKRMMMKRIEASDVFAMVREGMMPLV